jgi:hypothetical protein
MEAVIKSLWGKCNKYFSEAKPVTCSETDCSICMCEIENKFSTPCGHIFHKECLKNWLKDKDTCPNCREMIVTSDIRYNNSKQVKRTVTIPTYVPIDYHMLINALIYLFKIDVEYQCDLDAIIDNLSIDRNYNDLTYMFFYLTCEDSKIPKHSLERITKYGKYYHDYMQSWSLIYQVVILNNVLTSFSARMWLFIFFSFSLIQPLSHFYGVLNATNLISKHIEDSSIFIILLFINRMIRLLIINLSLLFVYNSHIRFFLYIFLIHLFVGSVIRGVKFYNSYKKICNSIQDFIIISNIPIFEPATPQHDYEPATPQRNYDAEIIQAQLDYHNRTSELNSVQFEPTSNIDNDTPENDINVTSTNEIQ